MSPHERRCVKCGHVGRIAADFRVTKWGALRTCKRCISAENVAYQRDRRAKRRDAIAAAAYERTAQSRGVFERTLRGLETQWGAPFAQWTRAQHEAHSRLLRELAGIAEDGARRAVAA
jgi:hypothetical protein